MQKLALALAQAQIASAARAVTWNRQSASTPAWS